MSILQHIIDSYKNDKVHNVYLANMFSENVHNDRELYDMRCHFKEMGSLGEDSCYWIYYLLIKELDIRKFLEVGVHQGQIPILVKYLSRKFDKNIECHFVTPFDGSGDKYSDYEKRSYEEDFVYAAKRYGFSLHHDFFGHIGFSQDPVIQKSVRLGAGQFDLMYIDGSHNFHDVVSDIAFYVEQLLARGGIVIFDDAMYYQEGNIGNRFNGHPDVSRAVDELIDGSDKYVNLFNISHNRIFRKL